MHRACDYLRLKGMRFKLLLLLILAVAAVALGGGFLVWDLNQPIGTSGKAEFTILPGESVQQIAVKLDQAGLMDSTVFVLYVRFKNLTSKIQAGRYEIPLTLTPIQVVELLQHGTFDVRLTFLEGWRKEQYLAHALANLAVDDESFSAEFTSLTKDLEGYLFPDTYVVPVNIGAGELIEILGANFNKKYQDNIAALESASGLTREQIVIIASLLERESVGDREELGTIGGILIKRWKAGWYLGVDATVQYVLGRHWNAEWNDGEGRWEWWKDELTSQDLKIDSPYNTYKLAGLPPAPIASPGLDALSAAAAPLDSPYWFYLHAKIDGKIYIYYARTLEEHNQNVAKYLR